MYAFLDTIREICHLLEPAEWAALDVIIGGLIIISIVYAYLYWRETARDQQFSSAQRLFDELQSTEKDRADIIRKIILLVKKHKNLPKIEAWLIKPDDKPENHLPSGQNSETNDYWDPDDTWDTFEPGVVREIFTNNAIKREFDRSDEQKIRNIINSLNRIGLLVEEGILRQKMIFAISYPAIIQSWVICEPYVEEQERLRCVQYARRVERLANTAKNYADANCKKLKLKAKQDLKIYLFNNNTPIGSRTGSHGSQPLQRRTRVLVHQTCRKKWGHGVVIQRLRWARMKIFQNYSESLTFVEWLSILGPSILIAIGLVLNGLGLIGLLILGAIGLILLFKALKFVAEL